MTAPQLKVLARIGAGLRLQEITREAAAIRKAFPGLSPDFAGALHASVVKPKRVFSAAAKRRMSAGMRKFWKARKAAAKAKAQAKAGK